MSLLLTEENLSPFSVFERLCGKDTENCKKREKMLENDIFSFSYYVFYDKVKYYQFSQNFVVK